MVSLHYFASIREAVGRSSEELTLPGSVTDVQGLIEYLVARDPEKLQILALDSRVLVAVNQTVVDRS